ncbi:hypothetical protein [Maribellus mangrovi]|uniref:hypothetical protein n=1 Tax=Maribellus mangrovi TaxID=3133146 RepID=UPI0030EDA88E
MTAPIKNESVVLFAKYEEYLNKFVSINLSQGIKTYSQPRLLDEQEFEKVIIELYHKSREELFYWEFCPLIAYEHTFNSRKEEFCSKFQDSTILDFIEEESMIISRSLWIKDPDDTIREGRPDFERDWVYLGFKHDEYYSLLLTNSELAANLYYSRKKKLDLLKRKAEIIKNPINNPVEEHVPIDFSNNSKAERIVFLHELGILDYLKNKMESELGYFSVNKLAEMVSTFTDIQYKTAQPYLNPIYSDAIQKNNPLTTDNVERVIKKLNRLGFVNTKSS